MARPDHAFRTSTHTVFATDEAGVYRTEPDGHELRFSLEAQHLPPGLDTPEFERAAMAWVITRGGRTLNLNGRRRPLSPQMLDRPPAGPVRRLITIAPSNAEIVGALDSADLLVGVESTSDFPPEVKRLPQLGPELNVDMEALAALKPELVLASLTVPGMERSLTALEQTGIPYLVFAPRGLADIFEEIERAGAAIGRPERAEALLKRLRGRLEVLRRGLEEKGAGCEGGPAPVRVYLEWWPKPMFSPGRTCWSNELIELAGGVNVFRAIPSQSGEVTAEEVTAADPEVIFVSWCGVPKEKLDPKRVLKRGGLEKVTAVREGRVYPIDESLLGRPGPRVFDGIDLMAEKLAAFRG